MRLSDLHRTTSFRLAVLFLLLFGTAATLLCLFLYTQRGPTWTGAPTQNS
ncbi:MAG TPA: hypothetical protein VMB73_03000 [Acetobacteraceae bacterium]|nr:hypothetical protein [Acetobacteraceae bacterium]